MLSFHVDRTGRLVAVRPIEDKAEEGYKALNRWDFKSLEYATDMAQRATELTGQLHVAVDSGAYVSPRYDVIEAPIVGAEVSRAFNGDYYPAGKIISVSKSLKRVATDDGSVFYRVRQSGTWLCCGTWAMVRGHISRLNPEF